MEIFIFLWLLWWAGGNLFTVWAMRLTTDITLGMLITMIFCNIFTGPIIGAFYVLDYIFSEVDWYRIVIHRKQKK